MRPSATDVEALVKGADVVVSCVGNPNKQVQIMEATADNVLNAAAQESPATRCIFISSIGCGGTSWLLSKILSFAASKASWEDYEAADLRIRSERKAPYALARPYGLNNKPAKIDYKASTKSSVTFALPISREDVANFLLAITTDTSWDGPMGVQLTGA